MLNIFFCMTEGVIILKFYVFRFVRWHEICHNYITPYLISTECDYLYTVHSAVCDEDISLYSSPKCWCGLGGSGGWAWTYPTRGATTHRTAQDGCWRSIPNRWWGCREWSDCSPLSGEYHFRMQQTTRVQRQPRKGGQVPAGERYQSSPPRRHCSRQAAAACQRQGKSMIGQRYGKSKISQR